MGSSIDNLRKLYESGTKHYTLPDFNTFARDMQDVQKRMRFYENMRSAYDLPDFDTFSRDIGAFSRIDAEKVQTSPLTTVESPNRQTTPVQTKSQPKQQVDWKPSSVQQADLQRQVNEMNTSFDKMRTDYQKRMDGIRKGGRPDGVIGSREFNPQRGTMERVYYTHQGDRVGTQMEQSQRNTAYNQWWENNTEVGKRSKEKRLQREFEQRLDAMWSKIDPIDGPNAAEKTWADADAKFKEQQNANAKREWGNYAAMGGGPGMRIVTSSENRHANMVDQLTTYDLDTLMQQAWNNLGEDGQKKLIGYCHKMLKYRNPGADDQELYRQAEQLARQQSNLRLYNLAIENNLPKDKWEYFFRKVGDMNSIVSLEKGLARTHAGKTGGFEAYESAMNKWDEDNKMLGVAGMVTGLALDLPTLLLAGSLGSAAAKGSLWGLGRLAAGKGATSAMTNAAARKIGSTLGGRVIAGVAGGAANFGAFQSLKEAENQFVHGGHVTGIDENGLYETEGYSGGALLKELGHGVMMGAAIGWLGPLTGNVSDKLVRATSSTAGKMAIRSGAFVGSTLAEGTIFSTPEWISGKRNAFDVWTDNIAMMIGFKGHHAFKSAPRVIAEFGRTADGRKGMSSRIREFLDGTNYGKDQLGKDMALTKDEKAELDKYGYNLNDMVRDADDPSNGAVVEARQQKLPSELTKMVTDSRLSEAVRAKMYYYATGRKLPMSTIIDGELLDNDGGRHFTVRSIAANNNIITSRTFKNRKAAEMELERINRQVELNKVDLGERYMQVYDIENRLQEACRKVAEENGWNAADVYRMCSEARRGNKEGVSKEYEEAMQGIFGKVIEAIGEYNEAEVTDAMRQNLNDQFGVDIDKALSKEAKHRTDAEQDAIEQYIKELMPEKDNDVVDIEAEDISVEDKNNIVGNKLIDSSFEPRPKGRAVMKFEDREVEVLDGNVQMTDDGSMVDASKSDATIMVRDKATGKVEMASPKDMLKYEAYEETDPEQAAAPADVTPEGPKYKSGYIELRNEDGTTSACILTGYMKDGEYEYYMTGDLKTLHYATEEELDARMVAYEPDEVKPVEAMDRKGEVLNAGDRIGYQKEDGSYLSGTVVSVDEDGKVRVRWDNVDYNLDDMRDVATLSPEFDMPHVEKGEFGATTPAEETPGAGGPQPSAPAAGAGAEGEGAEPAESVQESVLGSTQVPDEESVQQPSKYPEGSALSRIKKQEDGETPDYVGEENPELAWDASVEEVESEEDALTLFKGDIKDAEAELRKADKMIANPKGKTRQERMANIAAARQAKAEAEAVISKLQSIIAVPEARAQAEKAAVEAAEAERKAEEEAKAKAEAEWQIEKNKMDKRLRETAEKCRDYPEIIEQLTDLTPQSIYEVAAKVLMGNKVLWNSVRSGDGGSIIHRGMKDETGYGESERKKMFGLFASREKGGRSIEELAEDIFREECAACGVPYDNAEARNALLEVLSSCRTRGDLYNYIINNRIEAAEKQLAAIEKLLDEACYEAYHMSRKEYEDYEEIMLEEAKKHFEDFDENEYNGNIADELANRNKDGLQEDRPDEPEREVADNGSGSEVLPGSQTDKPGGVSENAGGQEVSGGDGVSMSHPEGYVPSSASEAGEVAQQSEGIGDAEMVNRLLKERDAYIEASTRYQGNDFNSQMEMLRINKEIDRINRELDKLGYKPNVNSEKEDENSDYDEFGFPKYTDIQGNPLHADGSLLLERVSDVSELRDDDFNIGFRNVELPTLPQNISDAIGANGRNVVVKKNIFIKNKKTHGELTPEESRYILRSALYSTDIVGKNQPIKRPDYRVAIHLGDNNSIVVLDVYATKKNIEIVGWRKIDQKGLERMKKQSEREGGQFLILSSHGDFAAALSDVPLKTASSERKDSDFAEDKQENEQKSSAQQSVESEQKKEAGPKKDLSETAQQKQLREEQEAISEAKEEEKQEINTISEQLAELNGIIEKAQDEREKAIKRIRKLLGLAKDGSQDSELRERYQSADDELKKKLLKLDKKYRDSNYKANIGIEERDKLQAKLNELERRQGLTDEERLREYLIYKLGDAVDDATFDYMNDPDEPYYDERFENLSNEQLRELERILHTKFDANGLGFDVDDWTRQDVFDEIDRYINNAKQEKGSGGEGFYPRGDKTAGVYNSKDKEVKQAAFQRAKERGSEALTAYGKASDDYKRAATDWCKSEGIDLSAQYTPEENQAIIERFEATEEGARVAKARNSARQNHSDAGRELGIWNTAIRSGNVSYADIERRWHESEAKGPQDDYGNASSLPEFSKGSGRPMTGEVAETGRKLGRALGEIMQDSGMKVVMDGEKMRQALDVAEVSVMEFAKINQSSAELDRQLDAYSNGERNKSLSFGRPGAILRYAGLKRGNIEMEIGTFTEHLKKHNLSVEDIKGIVKAINDPILVYDWGQTGASHIIVTDMAIPNRGQLTIAVRIVNKGKNPNISEIASIHIKEADRMTTEILSNEDFASKNLRYVNKKRAQDWLSGASPKEATHQGSNTSSLTNRRELDAKLQKIFDAQAEKQKKDKLVQAITVPNERDAEYAKAVADGDFEKARRMLEDEAARKGYSPESDYQGESAFNGAAPSRNGYYESREEMQAAIEDETFEGDVSLDVMFDNMDRFPLADLISERELMYHGRYSDVASRTKVESIRALRRAYEEYRRGNKGVKVKIYRSVPSGVKEGVARNGDWVTLSRTYAKDNAEIHSGYDSESGIGWSERGASKIIEMEIPLKDLWWDQNDINEWGYDDGKGYVYRNTKNNRKLLEPTYDKNGNLIPLSKRFDLRTAGTEFLRTRQGEVYGFVKDGVIYLDPEVMNPNTPVHEYTHLWDKALQVANPELWARGKELMKELPLWEEVKNDPEYSDIADDEDLLASEVHSRLAGEEGEKHLDDMVKESKKQGDYVDEAKAVSLKNRIKAWLKDVLSWVRDAFSGKWSKKDLDSLTVEEFAKMPLKDLVSGVNPVDVAQGHGADMRGGMTERMFVGKKGAAAADKKAEATVRMDNLRKAREMERGFEAKKERIKKLRNSDPLVFTGNENEGKYELSPQSATKYILDELRGEYVNEDTGDKINVSRKGAEKVMHHDVENEIHLKSAAYIPDMLRKAIFIDEVANEKDKNSYDSYRYYVVGLKIGGIDYTAKLAIGVKNGNTYYDHSLTEIDKNNLPEAIDPIKSGFGSKEVSDVKDKRLISLLQINNKENEKKIKMATGWERGADGKWRYEEPDGKVIDKGELEEHRDSDGEAYYTGTLGDIWDSEELYSAYPELKGLPVVVQQGDGSAAALYTPGRNGEKGSIVIYSDYAHFKKDADVEARIAEIERSPEYLEMDKAFEERDADDAVESLKRMKAAKKKFYESEIGKEYHDLMWGKDKNHRVKGLAEHWGSTLAHEIQHAIQHIEGFAKGGNLESAEDYLRKRRETALDLLEARVAEIRQEAQPAWDEVKRINSLEWNDDNWAQREAELAEAQKRAAEYDDKLKIWERLLSAAKNKEGAEISKEEKTEIYQQLAGEVEARNVSRRMEMSAEERRKSLAEETEDVSREDQIFLHKGLGTAVLNDREARGVSLSEEDEGEKSMRLLEDDPFEKPETKKVTTYKWFRVKNGELYPAMIDNPSGAGTPRGVALGADTAEPLRNDDGSLITNSRGRISVKPRKLSKLAWRPDQHGDEHIGGEQFLVKNPQTGEKDMLAEDMVLVECEMDMTKDYTLAALEYGTNKNGVLNYTQAGVPYITYGGGYRYRTNANPDVNTMTLSHAVKLKRILDDNDYRALCQEMGIKSYERRGGDIDLASHGLQRGEQEPYIPEGYDAKGKDVSEEVRNLPGYRRNPIDFDHPNTLKYFEVITRDAQGNIDKDKAKRLLEYYRAQYEATDAKVFEKHGPELHDDMFDINGMNERQTEMSDSSEEGKRRQVESMSERLNTPVRIVDNVEDITDADPEMQEKMRKSKGWYDHSTGEVVINMSQNRNVGDVAETMLHEIVGHKGLRELIGKERYRDFLRDVYEHCKKDVKEKIAEKAARNGWDFEKATDEYLSELAEKGFEDFTPGERSIWRSLKDRVLKALDKLLKGVRLPKWIKLGDNELRYMLWRSHENLRGKGDDYVSVARDVAKRRDLGLEDKVSFRDGETDDVWKDQSLGLEERITNASLRLSNHQEGDKTLRNDAVRAVCNNLQDLLHDMRNRSGRTTSFKGADAKVESGVERTAKAQRVYDRVTVKRVGDLARVLIRNGYLKDMTDGEVQRILSVLKGAAGTEDISSSVEKMMDIMINNQLKSGIKTLDNLLHIRGSKVDARGVEVQGHLDADGANMMKALRRGMNLSEKELKDQIDDAMDRMSDSNQVIADNAAVEYTGLQMAMDYVQDITGSRNEELELRRSLNEAKEDMLAGRITRDTYDQLVEATDDAIRKNKIERAEAYNRFIGKLSGSLRQSIDNANEWREAEKQRIQEIHHNANSDMEGMPSGMHRDKPTLLDGTTNFMASTLLAPLSSFEQMIRGIAGTKTSDGDGYLPNRFIRGLNDARAKEIRGMRGKMKQLDDKVKEIFTGDKRKVKSWGDLIRLDRKLPKMTISYYDRSAKEDMEVELSQGNLLYIYMVDKMSDGRMKLRKMGIKEEDVEAISNFLDPRVKAVGDWVQSEFLKETREEYNETHKRMFGAPMAAIDNYFPLKVLKDARGIKEDIDAEDSMDGVTSTVTGAIKKRLINALALDIKNANAFNIVMDHLAEMEHWNAFAEVGRDMNTLLSYSKFRNRVKNMRTVYGTGDKLWKNFKDVTRIAFGSYHQNPSDFDKGFLALARGVTAAKVAFRVNTALKQLLSLPAVIPDLSWSGLKEGLKNPCNPFSWCMGNLPVFEERWRSRISGDPRLMKTERGWNDWRRNVVELAARAGMTPNAFIDAMVCSVVAKCIYDTKLTQYLKDGYTRTDADLRAKQDASIGYNLSQQSSEGAYLAPIQANKNWLSVMMTVFRNSPMSYTRQVYDSFRNLKRNLAAGNKSKEISFMAKQILRDWRIEPDTATDGQRDKAETAAKNRYNRSLRRDALRLLTYGFVLPGLWSLGGYWLYMLLGKDDKEKDVMKDDIYARLATAPFEGLTGGDVLSNVAAGIITGQWNENTMTKDMPVSQDIEQIAKKLCRDERTMDALNDIFNLCVQSGFGFNPATIENAVIGILDACGNDVHLANEAAIVAARILNYPESQVKKLYFDEIGLSGAEASELSPSQIAERYAQMQVKLGRAVMPWTWDDEAAIESRMKGRYGALGAAQERYDRLGDESMKKAYAEYYARYRGIDKRVQAAKELAKTDYVSAAKEMAAVQKDPDYNCYKVFVKLDQQFTKLSGMWIDSKSGAEAQLIQKTVEDYRAAMVKVFDNVNVDDDERDAAMRELRGIVNDFNKRYVEMQPRVSVSQQIKPPLKIK